MNNKEKLAWAAGLFDGEGYIGRNAQWHGFRLVLGMTDKTTVNKFAKIMNLPFVSYKVIPKKKSHKICYRWQLGKTSHVKKVLKMLLPYLITKKAKAIEA